MTYPFVIPTREGHESRINWDDYSIDLSCTCGWMTNWDSILSVPEIAAIWCEHVVSVGDQDVIKLVMRGNAFITAPDA